MADSFAYQIGKAIGALPRIVRLTALFGALFAFIVYYVFVPNEANKHSAEANALQAEVAAKGRARAASEAERARNECRSSIPTMKREYDRLMVAHKYWDAALIVRNCAESLHESELLKLVATAEIQSHLQTINDPSAIPYDKVRAIDMLARDYPDRAKPYVAMKSQILAKAEKAEKAREAQRRRSEGVRIGMTMEEVLASKWGKPNSVNRTIYRSGTREQWVYSGQNYLYFENGVLVAIQN